jgi:hypothetical protein
MAESCANAETTEPDTIDAERLIASLSDACSRSLVGASGAYQYSSV